MCTLCIWFGQVSLVHSGMVKDHTFPYFFWNQTFLAPFLPANTFVFVNLWSVAFNRLCAFSSSWNRFSRVSISWVWVQAYLLFLSVRRYSSRCILDSIAQNLRLVLCIQAAYKERYRSWCIAHILSNVFSVRLTSDNIPASLCWLSVMIMMTMTMMNDDNCGDDDEGRRR